MFRGAQDWHKLEKLGPWGKASVPALGSCWAAESSGLESYCLLQLLGWGGTSWAFRGPSELSVFWVAHLCFTCYVRWFQTLGLAYTFCIHISYISSRHQMLALWDIFTNWYCKLTFLEKHFPPPIIHAWHVLPLPILPPFSSLEQKRSEVPYWDIHFLLSFSLNGSYWEFTNMEKEICIYLEAVLPSIHAIRHLTEPGNEAL